jgi:hypothetical protein
LPGLGQSPAEAFAQLRHNGFLKRATLSGQLRRASATCWGRIPSIAPYARPAHAARRQVRVRSAPPGYAADYKNVCAYGRAPLRRARLQQPKSAITQPFSTKDDHRRSRQRKRAQPFAPLTSLTARAKYRCRHVSNRRGRDLG